jgi:N6-adenosine-specific RNA methylase IME4
VTAEHAVSYPTVLADPPWNLQQLGTRPRHYNLMSTEQIGALPVRRLAASDAHVWLWVTNGSIFAGRSVMEAWGFSYRSGLAWIKRHFGMGTYLRNQTEHLLLGGALPRAVRPTAASGVGVGRQGGQRP